MIGKTMTDSVNEQPNDTPEGEKVDAQGRTELQLLKERAKQLNVSHSPNIGVDKLREKVTAAQNGEPDVPEDVKEPVSLPEASEAPENETKTQKRERLMKDAMKLVRVRIYNMNPSKADLNGEIVTVANNTLGTIRKFIPFGEATDGGYHIPFIIYKQLKSRKFQAIQTRKVKGEIKVTTRLAPEYNIEVLEPLTKAELKELADKQGAAERLGA